MQRAVMTTVAAGLATVLFVSSCSNDLVSDLPGFAWRDSAITARPSGCDGPLDRCGGVDLRFPVFSAVDAGNDSIARLLTSRVIDAIAQEMGGPDMERATNLAEATQRFIAEYEDFLSDFPESEQRWTMQGTATVTAMDSIACIEVATSSYMGGAHPLSYTTYVLADMRTGKFLTLTDLTADTTRLKTRAEAAFRKQAGLAPGASLTEGTEYWFDGDAFMLPANIGLTADSVVLYYNPYEIGPYVLGSTVVTLPRTVLH
jgi:hypothetical protein